MLKTLDVPTTSISELKKNPRSLFKTAADKGTGVYVLNRNTPSGIVMSVTDYEEMVKRLDQLEDLFLEKEVAERLANDKGKYFTDEEVRGKDIANAQKLEIDENDGWE